MFALLLLAACGDNKVDLEDTAPEPLAELGDPFVAVYAATSPGSFRSDCNIEVDLYEGDEIVASAQMMASGGEWAGTMLPGTTQYRAVATWESCTTGPDGYGEFESSVFSGVQGDFFLFRYNGVLAAFEYVEQRVDFEGGVAEATFSEEMTADEVAAMAESLGLAHENVEGNTWRFSWESPMAVGKVLSDLSAERWYLSGGPVWLRKPDWW
jgi:hypothetical protein